MGISKKYRESVLEYGKLFDTKINTIKTVLLFIPQLIMYSFALGYDTIDKKITEEVEEEELVEEDEEYLKYNKIVKNNMMSMACLMICLLPVSLPSHYIGLGCGYVMKKLKGILINKQKKN